MNRARIEEVFFDHEPNPEEFRAATAAAFGVRRVDVQADIDAINRGEAIVDRPHATAWINGRLWGYHTDTGTAYPIEGDGFVPMSQLQYFALRMYARYNGVNPRSERELAHHPDLTDEDRELARRVWRMREGAAEWWTSGPTSSLPPRRHRTSSGRPPRALSAYRSIA